MKSTSLAYALVLALVFPCLVLGQETKKTEKWNEYDFPVEPGATLSITVTFHAATTNGTFFYDKSDPTGKQYPDWPGCGNFDTVHPRSFQYTNPGPTTKLFGFSAAYKVTSPPNDDRSDWYPGYGVVVSYSEKAIVIGFPNSQIPGGGGPTNCEATITISAGKLPNPGKYMHSH